MSGVTEGRPLLSEPEKRWLEGYDRFPPSTPARRPALPSSALPLSS